MKARAAGPAARYHAGMSEEREHVWRETAVALLKSFLALVAFGVAVVGLGLISELFWPPVQ